GYMSDSETGPAVRGFVENETTQDGGSGSGRIVAASFSRFVSLAAFLIVGFMIGILTVDSGRAQNDGSSQAQAKKPRRFDATIADNSQRMLEEGKNTFRFDTFGDETFWGDTLKLHQALEGSGLGGVGAGVNPKTALDLGLKVDVDALPKP